MTSPKDPNAQAYPQKCLPKKHVKIRSTAVTVRNEFHSTGCPAAMARKIDLIPAKAVENRDGAAMKNAS